jgi:hypothetical protein
MKRNLVDDYKCFGAIFCLKFHEIWYLFTNMYKIAREREREERLKWIIENMKSKVKDREKNYRLRRFLGIARLSFLLT